MTTSLTTERSNYRPGEEIRGTATWTLPQAPSTAELRLFWHTQGKGDRDAATVETQTFPDPQPTETRPFSLQAPNFPSSFSGKLISLVWGLELVLDPDGSKAIELVIAPQGREIDLYRTDLEPPTSAEPESPWMPIP